MHHRLKINSCYLAHIMEGKKDFEVRKNDRDFQVGDTLSFDEIDNPKYLPHGSEHYDNQNFLIVYIHSDLGMQEGYVVLGLQKK